MLIGEVDAKIRREEVRNGETGKDVNELMRTVVANPGGEQWSQRHRCHSNDTRHAFDGELAKGLARFAREHRRKMLVVPKQATRNNDAANGDVLHTVETAHFITQAREELVEFANAECFKQHLFAARKQPIDACSRHSGNSADVIDGHLGEPNVVTARKGRIEDTVLNQISSPNADLRCANRHA